jgi:endonuclease YncB( thermonuclease family)
MTIVVVIAAVLALAAALRRLARTAVALVGIALALGAGPTVLASLDDLGVALPGGPERGSGAMTPRTVDGDTFNISQDGGRGQVTVRVALVDAGEASSTRYGRPTCGGEQAKRFASRWATRHSSVQLRRVAGLPPEDHYGRRLARVVGRDGRDYGRALVQRGWARVVVYEPPRGSGAAYLARLRRAEATARHALRGGWGRCGWARKSGGLETARSPVRAYERESRVRGRAF